MLDVPSTSLLFLSRARSIYIYISCRRHVTSPNATPPTYPLFQAAGMGGGILAAMVQRSAFPSLPDYVGFLGTGLISTVLMFGVTLATPPTPMPALVKFYTNTRPSGFWGPVAALALEKDGFDGQAPEGGSFDTSAIRREHHRDRATAIFAVVWQLSLFLAMMAATMAQWGQFAVVFSVWAGSSSGLWFCWLRHLGNEPDTARMRGGFESLGTVSSRETEMVGTVRSPLTYDGDGERSDEEVEREGEGGGDNEDEERSRIAVGGPIF